MNTKFIAAGAGLLALAAFSTSAWADAEQTINFHRTNGQFACVVDAADSAEVIIDTHGVLVQGPGCDGHALHTDVKSLKQYSYKWKADFDKNKDMSVNIKVIGNVKNLSCEDDSKGRAEAPGGWCFLK